MLLELKDLDRSLSDAGIVPKVTERASGITLGDRHSKSGWVEVAKSPD